MNVANDPIRLLVVEDEPAMVRLIRAYLDEAEGLRIELEQADKLSAGLRLLSNQSFDAILLDLSLPDSRGLETLRSVYEHSPDVPIIVMTGLNVDELATEALQAGAKDYLDKYELDTHTLVRSIRFATGRAGGQGVDPPR